MSPAPSRLIDQNMLRAVCQHQKHWSSGNTEVHTSETSITVHLDGDLIASYLIAGDLLSVYACSPRSATLRNRLNAILHLSATPTSIGIDPVGWWLNNPKYRKLLHISDCDHVSSFNPVLQTPNAHPYLQCHELQPQHHRGGP